MHTTVHPSEEHTLDSNQRIKLTDKGRWQPDLLYLEKRLGASSAPNLAACRTDRLK